MVKIRVRKLAFPLDVTLAGAAFVILAICEVLLIIDVVTESLDIKVRFFSANHILLEWIAVLGLGFTVVYVGVMFWRTLDENRKYRTASGLANGEFLGVIVREMEAWNLSVSERQIALMLIKGLTIQEIANVRQTKTGTIKSQCNAVYRKAGVHSRNELAAFFIEDLMNGLDLGAEGGAAIIRQ